MDVGDFRRWLRFQDPNYIPSFDRVTFFYLNDFGCLGRAKGKFLIDFVITIIRLDTDIVTERTLTCAGVANLINGPAVNGQYIFAILLWGPHIDPIVPIRPAGNISKSLSVLELPTRRHILKGITPAPTFTSGISLATTPGPTRHHH